MNPKLLEVLKKAKAIDQRAKQFDSADKTVLEANMNNKIQSMSQGLSENMVMSQQTKNTKPIDVNSDVYKQRVKESKLPPEIQRAMLDNPIQQPDSPGTFSMNEEMIREINPSYGNQISETVVRQPQQTTNYGVSETEMRKMIAEEIAKALPSIVENYFDKKMIKENIEVLKAIKVRRKTQ